MIKIKDLSQRRYIYLLDNYRIEGGSDIIVEKPYGFFGKRVWIGNWVHIRPNVHIGDYSEIRDLAHIGPNVIIGKNTRIYHMANICMGAKIGNNCFIGMGVALQNDKEIAWPNSEDFVCEPPIIKDNVRIGARAIIGAGVTLAKNCRIGCGAVVTKSTKENLTYVGNPAKALEKK
ncbi:MAG: DapH/DapD/GlmU-related protein [Nitrososphaeraceae archaeon]|nr:DapH/DapD/GlmU-related protein [Nitrososphaeraceae archaeon]